MWVTSTWPASPAWQNRASAADNASQNRGQPAPVGGLRIPFSYCTRRQMSLCFCDRFGGGKGIRTPGLVIANDALYFICSDLKVAARVKFTRRECLAVI